MHRKRLENPDAKRPKAPRKDYDKLVAAAWSAGWWCERGTNNYIKCWPPGDGKMVVVPSTPKRGGRGLENLRLAFRRAGLKL